MSKPEQIHFLDKLRDFDRLPALLQQIGADINDAAGDNPHQGTG